MIQSGEIISFKENLASVWALVLGQEQDLYMLVTLEKSSLAKICLPENAQYPADMPRYVNTWQTRSLPEQQIEGTGIYLHAEFLDTIFRAMGKQVAKGHFETVHAPKTFIPGTSTVPVSGKCWDHEEAQLLTEASLDFWLTTGRFNDSFEARFATLLNRKFALTVNSGSSANLLAVSALFSPLLKEKQLQGGDEVITVAAGFPTTVAPLVQYGLIPVFVDVDLATYNVIVEQVEAAITPKTRAIMLAHTLGNPFDVAAIMAIAKQHNLWLIEDACDALGSTYTIDNQEKPCGSFGHISTFSFYPAHHITMGEGGAVVCDDPLLYKILLSMRDWGRDCWCPPGKNNTCKMRYSKKFPNLPDGYDHKYVYSHLGYNLKITDMQAAVGLAQLDKLANNTSMRRDNFTRLYTALSSLNGTHLLLPQATENSAPSWFGFPVTFDAKYSRREFLEYMASCRIDTRLLFAGDVTCQPCFEGVEYRRAFPLVNTERILHSTLWLGVFPGLGFEHIDYIAEKTLVWFAK